MSDAINPKTLVLNRLLEMELSYGITVSPAAVAELVAIGYQESGFSARDQITNGPAVIGPATGFWQFELGGGVKGVMTHNASKCVAIKCCAEYGVPFIGKDVWVAFTKPEFDGLACSFARLLLLTDPRALPEPHVDQEETAWNYYLRNWRPGKPHRKTWAANWKKGIQVSTEV